MWQCTAPCRLWNRGPRASLLHSRCGLPAPSRVPRRALACRGHRRGAVTHVAVCFGAQYLCAVSAVHCAVLERCSGVQMATPVQVVAFLVTVASISSPEHAKARSHTLRASIPRGHMTFRRHAPVPHALQPLRAAAPCRSAPLAASPNASCPAVITKMRI